MSSKVINLIFIGNILYPTGMAGTKRIQHFIDHLSQYAEISIKLLLLRQGGRKILAPGLKGTHQGVAYQTIGNDLRPGFGFLFKFLKYCWQGFRFLKSNFQIARKNVLYVYGYPNIENILFILYAKLSGYKIIFDIVEDNSTFEYFQHRLAEVKNQSSLWLQKWIWRLANQIIVISNHLFQKFATQNKKKCLLTLLPITIQLEKFKNQVNGFYEPMKIFYGGTFAVKDGVETLISAFEQVAAKFPEVLLYLSGMGVSARINLIKSKIENSAFRNRIQYLGYLNDDAYYQFLKSCHIFSAIRVDSQFAQAGFPFKLGEYLATGRPVLVSNIGEISTYLTDKKNAIFVNPDSIDSIVAGIEYLIKNPVHSSEIGHAGKKVAFQNFDVQVVGQKLYKILQTI
jgi:glycosyltransferase involved in cell wall biosynthesis